MVIVDVKMPGIAGITLLMNMKDIRPEIPIAIFTGYDRTALAVPDEADAFMIKSSSYKKLKEFVRKYAQENKWELNPSPAFAAVEQEEQRRKVQRKNYFNSLDMLSYYFRHVSGHGVTAIRCNPDIPQFPY